MRTFWSIAVGAVLVAVLGLVLEEPRSLLNMTAFDGVMSAYLGVVSTGGTFWLMQRAVVALTPAVASAYAYAPPFVTMLVIFIQDPQAITWRWVPGALLVIAAFALLIIMDEDSVGSPEHRRSGGGTPRKRAIGVD